MALVARPEVAPFPGRPFSVTPETVQAASCILKGWCWQALLVHTHRLRMQFWRRCLTRHLPVPPTNLQRMRESAP